MPRQVPEPRDVKLIFRVPDSVREKVKERARAESYFRNRAVSMNDIVVEALESYLTTQSARKAVADTLVEMGDVIEVVKRPATKRKPSKK